MEAVITKSKKSESGMFISTIEASTLVKTSLGTTPIKDWFMVATVEPLAEGEVLEDFNPDAWNIRLSEVIGEDGLKKTFKWLEGEK